MSEFLLVFTTLGSKEEAEKIALAVTKERLTVCSQIEGPITSVYWWQDKLEKDEEWRCTFKTSNKLFPELEAKLKQLHPYETPEILAIPIENGSKEYVTWMKTELK